MSERFRRKSMVELLRRPPSVLIKARLHFVSCVAVTDLTLLRTRRRRGITPVPLRRLETVVLVSDLTRPVREAMAFAEALGAPVTAVHVDVEDRQRERRRQALPGTIVNVVIPEFIVPGRIAQLLHNQTGLAIKGVLATEAGIAVTSVPFHPASAAAMEGVGAAEPAPGVS